MLFLNPSLLFGLVGVAIPVILHLFNRKAAQHTDWGAMQFLSDSMESRSRRIQLEDALLMASRCLLIGMIALALARPYVPPGSRIPYMIVLPALLLAIGLFAVAFALWENRRVRGWLLLASISLISLTGAAIFYENYLDLRRLGGAGEQDIALIIDSSTSMALKSDGSDKSTFEMAVDEARDIILNSGNDSAFSIIAAGPSPVVRNPSPWSDRSKLSEILGTLAPSEGHMGGYDATLAAVRALAAGEHESKQIVVLTDGQNLGWQIGSPASWDIVAGEAADLPYRPALIVRALPVPKSFRNLAVTGIRLSREVVGVDREVDIVVSLRNTGTEAVTPQEIQLRLGSETLTDRSLGQLTPGVEGTATFKHQFARAGAQALTAVAVLDDDLDQDNRFSTAVTVIDHLNVLIIDGDPAPSFFDRASAFIELALAPGMLGDQNYLIEPTVVPAPQILNVQSFDAYQAVILADVPRLPAQIATRLEDYVRAGGGLLIAPGRRALPDFYNRWLAAPAQLRQAITTDAAALVPAPDLASFTHPALRRVAAPGSGDLASAALENYWQLEASAPGAIIAATLDNGAPFIASLALGSGKVVMTCCSLDTKSGNLATRQSFLPLVHEIIYHIANPDGLQLNLDPAATLTLLLDPDLTSPEELPIDTYAVTGPHGQLREAEIVSTRQGTIARISGGTMAGLYEIEIPESDREPLARILTPANTIPFTVKRLAEESQLTPLSHGDLAFLSRYLDVVEATSPKDILTILAGHRYGHELWRLLALGVLLLLILEIALSRWIAITRRTGSQEVIEFESGSDNSGKFRDQLERIKAQS